MDSTEALATPWKVRRPVAVALLNVMTLCLYGLVWYYKVNRELHDYGRLRGDAELGTSRPWRSLLAITLGGLLIVPTAVSYAGVVARLRRAERGATDVALSGAGLLVLLLGSLALGVAACAVATLAAFALAASVSGWLAAVGLIQGRLNAVWQAS